jgi:putative membrane protein insertion efficiency factor
MKWLRWFDDRVAAALIMAVRGYQLTLSPWLGRSCRFSPSCSQYGIDALEHHGTLSGVWLTAKRLLRCHPWCEGGYDPVPQPTTCQHRSNSH